MMFTRSIGHMRRHIRLIFMAMLAIGMLGNQAFAVSAAQDDNGDPAEFEGRSFGFTVAYDPSLWQIVDEMSDGIEDYVVFANGPGFVSLTASTAYGGDIVECQEDWVRYLRTTPGITDYRPLLDESGAVIGQQSDGVAFAAYAFTSTEGNEFFHIECLNLIEGEATLALVVEGFIEDYAAQLAATQLLLAGLDGTDATLPAPVGDGTGGTGGTPRSGGLQEVADELPGTGFADAFDDPAAGFLSTGSPSPTEVRYAYDGGEYVIQTLADYAGIWEAGVPGTYPNGALGVDVRMVSDSTEGAGTVLIGCRSSATDRSTNEYTLSLSPATGALTLTRWDDGEPTVLAEEIRDDLVTLGDATNRLELVCAGSTISAIVNAQAALSVEDATYATGSFFIGAGVVEGDTGTVETRWDNLEVVVVTP